MRVVTQVSGGHRKFQAAGLAARACLGGLCGGNSGASRREACSRRTKRERVVGEWEIDSRCCESTQKGEHTGCGVEQVEGWAEREGRLHHVRFAEGETL